MKAPLDYMLLPSIQAGFLEEADWRQALRCHLRRPPSRRSRVTCRGTAGGQPGSAPWGTPSTPLHCRPCIT